MKTTRPMERPRESRAQLRAAIAERRRMQKMERLQRKRRRKRRK